MISQLFQNLQGEKPEKKIIEQKIYFSKMAQCPPKTPDPCAQICPPPPPKPPCLPKPVMRGLHWAQTESTIYQALFFAAMAGSCYYFFVARPRRAAYKEYYL